MISARSAPGDAYSGLMLALVASVARAADNGVALTPPLGWSTWETCGDAKCSHDACTEAEVKDVATAMIGNGMRDAGWTFVNLDDCWTGLSRNVSRITWDETRFPSGIPSLASWLHEHGFKFGLYTSAGTTTCVGRPGSRGFYKEDAVSFASWGVDYVKFDWCGDIHDEVWLGAKAHQEFAAAMNATGRPMVLEVVAGYFFLRSHTARYANVWRFCEDHHDSFASTKEALACRIDQPRNASHTGAPGGWASMDLMTTGGAGCLTKSGTIGDHCPGQTDAAYTTEFVLWALTQSPMLVATDVRNLTSVMRELLLNTELLGAHQSTATPPGRLLGHAACGRDLWACQLWGRPLTQERTDWLVALVNLGEHPHDLRLEWSLLGWADDVNASVRDVLRHRDLAHAAGALHVPALAPHATASFRLRRLAT